MHTEQLERHIIDTIKEWQMKIGYKEENMRLYYPDVSNRKRTEKESGHFCRDRQ